MRDEEIADVRRVRHEISELCGHDVHKVAAYYRAVAERLRQSRRPAGSSGQGASPQNRLAPEI